MKNKSSLAIVMLLMLISLASISVVFASPIQTGVLFTKLAAPATPTVDIIYPVQGSTLSLGLHTVTVSATSLNGIKSVELKIDGPETTDGWVDITTSQNSENQYYFDWTVSTEGSYTITARATSTSNRKTDSVITVTVGEEPPPSEPVHDVAITAVNALPTSVEIGDNVIVTVTAQNQGDFAESFDVTASYDSTSIGTQTVTELLAGSSIILTFTWNTEGVAAGEYGISATTSIVSGDSEISDNSFIDGTVTVTTPGEPPTAAYQLFIEIDYMSGHEPTPEALQYMEEYYMGNNPSGDLIQIIFHADIYVDGVLIVNDEYSNEVPYDQSVTETEFFAINDDYNDHDFGYTSSWKWVLYGSKSETYPSAIGLTYVQSSRRDLLAGNYVFIADELADSWATSAELEIGAEAVVLMHEIGHTIGIAVVHPAFGEQYDPDTYSVMSYLSTDNAGLYGAWYYSTDYWATRNIDYYVT